MEKNILLRTSLKSCNSMILKEKKKVYEMKRKNKNKNEK